MPIRVNLTCTDCGENMDFTGQSFPTHPRRFEHLCPHCGYRTTVNQQYPLIEYQTLEELKAS